MSPILLFAKSDCQEMEIELMDDLDIHPWNPLGDRETLKEETLYLLDECTKHLPVKHLDLTKLRRQLQDEVFNLIILGGFNRGKSSIANILIGQPILPTGVTPLTSIPTIVEFSPVFSALVRFLDGSEVSIESDQIVNFVSEEANPENELGVLEICIRLPSPLLRMGVRLIDTPGIGSIHDHNTQSANSQLEHCDAAVLVLSADQPISKIEAEFLGRARELSSRIIVILNKVDYLHNEEIDTALAYVKRSIDIIISDSIPVIPFSVRHWNNDHGRELYYSKNHKHCNDIFNVLEHTFFNKKSNFLVEIVHRRLIELFSQTRFELDLESAALGDTVEELKKRCNLYKKESTKIHAEKDSIILNFERELLAALPCFESTEYKSWYSAQMEEMQENLLLQFNLYANESPKSLKNHLDGFIAAEVTRNLQKLDELLRREITESVTTGISRLNQQMLFLVEKIQYLAQNLFVVNSSGVSHLSFELPNNLFVMRCYPHELTNLEILTEFTLPDLPTILARKFPRIYAYIQRIERRRIVNKVYQTLDEVYDLAIGNYRCAIATLLRKKYQEIQTEVYTQFDKIQSDILMAMNRAIESASQSTVDRASREMEIARQRSFTEMMEQRIRQLQRTSTTIQMQPPKEQT